MNYVRTLIQFKKESSIYTHCLLVISRQVHLLRTVLRIRDVYPGSRIRLFPIPDPGSELFPSRIRIIEFKFFNPKKPKKMFLSSGKYDPGCSSRIPDRKKTKKMVSKLWEI
jgi:hypothetical protein